MSHLEGTGAHLALGIVYFASDPKVRPHRLVTSSIADHSQNLGTMLVYCSTELASIFANTHPGAAPFVA